MRKFIINVNGNSYEVEVEEVGVEGKVESKPVQKPNPGPANPGPAAAPKAAPAPKVEKKELVASEGQEVVESPMPGNIWKILVKEGDSIKSGDTLLILEAMKMENEILAPRDGVVASINTTEGASVNTGDKLVVLD
ncbi:MAG: acetyl-CoA carboxylase biotin carboxyl carrier protein subunit [Tissierellaceae bacterium]